MKAPVWVTLAGTLAFVLACGRGKSDYRGPPGLGSAPPDAGEEAPVKAEPEAPQPPALPAATAGLLVATSEGPTDVNGSWEAKAGVCEDPPMLQAIVDQRDVGVIVLVQFAGDSERVATYHVVPAGPELPPPPAAQVAAQAFGGGSAAALQAISGEVDITSMDNRRVSGSARVILQDVTSKRETGFALVFDSLPVRALSEAECRVADAPGPLHPEIRK